MQHYIKYQKDTDFSNMVFSINGKIQNQSSEMSIIITFTNKEPIETQCLTITCGSYSGRSLIIAQRLPQTSSISREFAFLVDCRGSMIGPSILNARKCLQFFIKSIPVDSSFNIIRFGSRFDSFLESSQPYNEQNVKEASEML